MVPDCKERDRTRGEGGEELERNYRDAFAGLSLAIFGGAAVLYALSKYPMGTVTRMGPGMMPVTLGAILLVFGIIIAVPALFQRGERVELRFRALIVLSASILSFALMIREFGLVPSVFATTLIATFAESKVTLVRALILSASTALLTWSIFILGLGLTLPSYRWPF